MTCMKTAAKLALALAGCVACASAADDGFCRLEEPGHPTINLMALGLGDIDYSIGSHINDGYDYVVNVCRELAYNDDTCHEGSGVCERHKRSDLATSVLGYTGSATLAWVNPDGVYTSNSSVRMHMSGAKCAANNNETEASTVITFVCSNREFLMLASEKPAACNVEFTFFTAQACGTPRYTCFNGTKCVPTDDNTGGYARYNTCAAECGVKAPRYACIEDKAYGFQCAEDQGGKYSNFEECSDHCIDSQGAPSDEE